ncbi:MAG: CoA-binding protein [Treponema sp.]|nr:CoA-binding protein [Treponema sp.]
MKPIPEPSRRRLVTLAALLSQQQTEKITSVTIASLTGWSQSVIRRDIALLELRAGVSNGYRVSQLHDAICEALHIGTASEPVSTSQAGMKSSAAESRLEGSGTKGSRALAHKCCIVGLGRLGAALLEASIFERSPFRVVAGFDASVNRTEVLRSTFPLYPLSQLESVIAREGIEYALLAVPDASAQITADRLAKSGIKGIVNYTGAVLTAPLPVENVAPVTALTNLLSQS